MTSAPAIARSAAPATVPAPGAAAAAGHAAGTPGSSFSALLAGTAGGTQGIRFSSHALDRIERRGIPLDEQALARLEGGVDRAAAKGSRDSLVMLDGTAFVVSVRNRTVVTAVDPQHMQEQVFTNIDSAVIA